MKSFYNVNIMIFEVILNVKTSYVTDDLNLGKAFPSMPANCREALLAVAMSVREDPEPQSLGSRAVSLAAALLITIPVSGFAQEESAITVRHGDRDRNQVAITVDDCYEISKVEAITELCQEYNITCTFFVIGSALKFQDAEVWKKVVEAGCEIGNHSWGHIDLRELNAHQIKFQMLRTQQKVDELLGYHYPMQVMRPPFGHTNNTVAKSVSVIGYQAVVRWDVSQTDVSKAIRNVENGSILLYHARAKDVRCLEELIPALLENGYECVTVSELLELDDIIIDETSEIYIYDKQKAKNLR